MALPDASFTVDGNANPAAHETTYGATVNLALVDVTDAGQISWSIDSVSKSDQTKPTITEAGAPTGATASFPMPADPGDGEGRAFRIKVTVTNQLGTDTKYGIVGAVNSAGRVPFVAFEELDRHAVYGWVDELNAMNAQATTDGPYASTPEDVSLTTGSAGASDEFARGDHVHSMPDASARSVLARSANSTGAPAWLQGTTNSTVLRSVSNALSFGEVTHEMIETIPGFTLLGNSGNSVDRMDWISIADGEIAGRTDSSLGGHKPREFSILEENAQTGTSYTLVLTDLGKVVSMDNVSANTLTVPPNSSVAFATGAVIYVHAKGAGQTTIAEGSGVTVNVASSKGLKISEQYETIMLRKESTDTWVATGALTA